MVFKEGAFRIVIILKNTNRKNRCNPLTVQKIYDFGRYLWVLLNIYGTRTIFSQDFFLHFFLWNSVRMYNGSVLYLEDIFHTFSIKIPTFPFPGLTLALGKYYRLNNLIHIWWKWLLEHCHQKYSICLFLRIVSEDYCKTCCWPSLKIVA